MLTSGCLDSPLNQDREPTETERSQSTDSEMKPPINKLVIEDNYPGNFSVRITGESREVVFNKSYSANHTEEIDLSGHFPADERRTVEIHVNGSRAWRRSIAWYEGYMLEIADDGTVREGKIEV
ncbi:hypothetical protein [Haloferax sp. DFSO60]|uniref:hypothetical protein n=1 Tax=Haloferax sp. DFSO60 TaxID=3388652 RepID=UPI003979B762